MNQFLRYAKAVVAFENSCNFDHITTNMIKKTIDNHLKKFFIKEKSKKNGVKYFAYSKYENLGMKISEYRKKHNIDMWESPHIMSTYNSVTDIYKKLQELKETRKTDAIGKLFNLNNKTYSTGTSTEYMKISHEDALLFFLYTITYLKPSFYFGPKKFSIIPDIYDDQKLISYVGSVSDLINSTINNNVLEAIIKTKKADDEDEKYVIKPLIGNFIDTNEPFIKGNEFLLPIYFQYFIRSYHKESHLDSTVFYLHSSELVVKGREKGDIEVLNMSPALLKLATNGELKSLMKLIFRHLAVKKNKNNKNLIENIIFDLYRALPKINSFKDIITIFASQRIEVPQTNDANKLENLIIKNLKTMENYPTKQIMLDLAKEIKKFVFIRTKEKYGNSKNFYEKLNEKIMEVHQRSKNVRNTSDFIKFLNGLMQYYSITNLNVKGLDEFLMNSTDNLKFEMDLFRVMLLLNTKSDNVNQEDVEISTTIKQTVEL